LQKIISKPLVFTVNSSHKLNTIPAFHLLKKWEITWDGFYLLDFMQMETETNIGVPALRTPLDCTLESTGIAVILFQ
jgi:hypothetical protein